MSKKEIPLTKKCSCCKQIKSFNKFSISRSRYDGLNTRCKECCSKKHREYRYSLTEEEFTNLLEKQNHQRAICKTDKPQAQGWCVDHNHSTGEVRGILCTKCNRGLGYFDDNPETLMAAIKFWGMRKNGLRVLISLT